MFRKIKQIVTGKSVTDGAGVRLTRVIGIANVKDFDPFLMLDAFDSKKPDDYIKGFPWHPHRGIETITYLITGDIEHGDSLGNKGSINDGCCQWMTAGSGIIHQEMPQACERMLGVQLWLNMPKKSKMEHPKYNDIRNENIAVMENENFNVRVISGKYEEIEGPITGDYVKPVLMDVSIKSGSSWSVKTKKENTLFIYIVEGSACFSETSQEFTVAKHAVLFDYEEIFYVKAGNDGVRLLFFEGQPLHESIAWGGPIVMNTDEELQLAFKELRENTFIKS